MTGEPAVMRRLIQHGLVSLPLAGAPGLFFAPPASKLLGRSRRDYDLLQPSLFNLPS